jgi:hypothetical protein
MQEVWRDIEPGMRGHLLRLMERFDLAYQTDRDRHTYLVVECLPPEAPLYQTEWDGVTTRGPWREMARTYHLNTLPAGIPSWFIAREHRFSIGLHWRNGVLLADGPARRHVALVEALREKHVVRLRVRGPHPQNFFALLRDGLEVTLARYPGLEVKCTVPCPGHDGTPCAHEFKEEQLVKLTERTPPRWSIQCPEAFEDVSIGLLLYGWEEQPQKKPAVSEELQKLRAELEELRGQARQRQVEDQARHEQVLVEIRQSREALQRELRLEELESVLADGRTLLQSLLAQVAAGQTERAEQLKEVREDVQAYAALMQREFANLFRREQAKIESYCPGLFLLRPLGTRGWLRDLVGQKIELLLLCERPGSWHPGRDGGRYELTQPAKWLTRLAPYLRRMCKVLKYTAPVVGPLLAEEWDEHSKTLKEAIERMEELVEQLPKDMPLRGGRGEMEHAEGAALRALRHLLAELDPGDQWGGLQRTLTPEHHYLWLCEEHRVEFKR